jgi:glycerol-3-phosphate acyltransferase PlsY
MSLAGKPIPSYYAYLVGMAALLGHIFPIWLQGKGGKGVATYLGVLLGLCPFVFLITITNWLGLFYTKRISSLSALFSVAMVPLWLYIFTDIIGALAGVVFAALIFYTHRENIKRLLSGTEPRFAASTHASIEEE